MVAHLFEYAGGPSGIVAGVVTDQDSNPIDNAYVKTIGFTRMDYSNPDGEYTIGGLITGTYDVRFRHPDYVEITVEDVSITLGEITYVNIMMQSPCDYVIGDFNNSGALNISDIIDSFSKLKTGSPDPGMVCECPPYSGEEWAAAMDVNSSCGFNVADVISAFSKLKTGEPELVPCEDCPPEG
ncbi:MAG: carboxypeptidase-like regulatory domain-containing protein [candidate division Zixibacteria bacterium]